MSAQKIFINSLSNPAKLDELLADDAFYEKLSAEIVDKSILSFFFDNLSRAKNPDYTIARQSYKILLKTFTPNAKDFAALCNAKGLDQKILISFLKMMVDEKVEKDGPLAMARMAEEAGEVLRAFYLKIVADDRNSNSNLQQKLVAIFDKYIKEKPIPAQFFFSNSRKNSGSISPSARFSPSAALEGNPWQNSCSPGASSNKKTIVVQRSFFEGKTQREIESLSQQIMRLINERFYVGGLHDGEIKMFGGFDTSILSHLQSSSTKEVCKALSKKSLAQHETLILSDENADILNGVFYHSLSFSVINNNFLKVLFYSNHNVLLTSKTNLLYIARSCARLGTKQTKILQDYTMTCLTSSEFQYKAQEEHFLELVRSSILAGNEGFLEIIIQRLTKRQDAPNVNGLITRILVISSGINPLQKQALLEIVANKNIALPTNFLILLSSQADLETMKYLLDKFPAQNVDEKNDYGTTALMLAAQNGHEGVVKFLIENGARVDEKDAAGTTALMFTTQNGHEGVVKFLIENGAKVDEKTPYGITPLMIAAQFGHEGVANFLIENGASVDEKDVYGSTPLMAAAQNGHEDVAKLLIEMGAKVDEMNNNKATPLIFAAQNGDEDLVKLLIENGAKVDEKDYYGSTPLMLAAQYGHKDVAKLLIEKRANVNEISNYGMTALMIAIQFDHRDVELLISNPDPAPPSKNLYISNASNLVDYEGNSSQTFQMSKAGEFLNLESLELAIKPRIKRDVFSEVKNGEFFRQNEATITDDLTPNLASLKDSFSPDSLAQMSEAQDAGYASFQITAQANKSIKLLGLNYPYEITALETDPASARITSLKIDEDGFYHLQTNQKCAVNYVLKFDPKTVEIEGDEAVDFINKYYEECTQDVPLPEKDSFEYHEAFLEAVYQSKSKKTFCGLRVEVALYKMRELKIDASNIKICTIDGNHVALETTDSNGYAKYLELGGTEVEFVYEKEQKKYEESKAKSPVTTSSEESKEDYDQAQYEESEAEFSVEILQKAEKNSPQNSATITAQTLIAATKKTPTPLVGKNEFDASLQSNKSPNLYITKNTKSLANRFAARIGEHSQEHSATLHTLETPIFILDNPRLLDLENSKFKITKSGEVVFDKQGFLADFLTQAQVFNRVLNAIEVTPAGFNAQDFAPTLIIDWSKFSPQERVALNSLIDENPVLNQRSFGGIRIVSLDNSLSKDSSFLGRHKEVYEFKEQAFRAPAAASSAAAQEVTLCDLEGFDNWKSTLFGEIVLQNNKPIWQKSDFVKALEKAEKTKQPANFNITNSSNPQGLEDFIARSRVLGYFEYQGFRISFSENLSVTTSNSPFNYAPLNLEKHRQHKNCLLEESPSDCEIINLQLFDSLLFTKTIKDGIYSEEAGLLEKAKDKTLKLFISSNLTNSQFYVLFNEAKKHNVTLQLYLAPNVTLPKGLENLPELELTESLDVYADKKIKSAIVLTNNSRKIIEDILKSEQEFPNTEDKNKDILVINVEDFSYQDLVSSTSYKINDDGSLSDFVEKESAFISALKAGQRIILKGEFSVDLLEMLQPLLLKPEAQNLMLIIETPERAIPPHLQFLEIDAKVKGEKEDTKKPAIIEEFAADISPQDFIEQRLLLVKNALAKNQMLHLTGISGVGKSTLVQEFCTKNALKLYSGLDSVANFAGDNSGGKKILFIDESNIENFHLTFLEELKRGEKRILYKGEILTLSENHKIVFASNPVEYGGGRNLQKLFSDKAIQELELKPMPQSYVMHLLVKDIFEKCSFVSGSDFESFKTFCRVEIEKYNKALTSRNPLTIRELQQEALLHLAAKFKGAIPYKKLSTPTFTSTSATREIEEQILAAINLLKLQQKGILPSAGTPGILLEGLPGMGKSVMIETYLKEYLGEDSFIKISSSSSLEEKIKSIEQAYEQGKAIMIDELDASIDDGLEKVLNLALSNSHPNEAKQKEVREGKLEIKPGFALFATSNGIELEGRKLISPAIRHRLKAPTKTQDLTPTQDEICDVVKSWLDISSKKVELQENVKALAAAFLEVKTQDPEYSMRDLKSYCRQFFGEEKQLGLATATSTKLAGDNKNLPHSLA